MYSSGTVAAWMLLAAIAGPDESAIPPLKKAAEPPAAARKTRHFVIQVKLTEVDEQGRETVLGEPKLQTTGGNAGVSIDHPDGRRFEITMKLTDRLGSHEDLSPAKAGASGEPDTVLKKLDQPIDLNIQQQSRKEVLREISRRTGVGIAIDPESTRGVVTEMDSPIDLKIKGETVSLVLEQLIEPLKLAYTVKHDVVLIAAAEKLLPAPEDFIIKTYDVADLVDLTENGMADFDPLIGRIKSSVMPSSWERKEAVATIRPFNSTMSIVVRQTSLGHAGVDRFLEKMRREMPKKITE